MSRKAGEALVVDVHGHLALATGLRAPDRVTLPTGMAVGEIWLPTLGAATAEALPGGWLLRLAGRETGATTLEVDLTDVPEVRVSGESGSWVRQLTPRHAELMIALVQAGPNGRSAAELAADLFADPTKVVTVRAEMSRLRRGLGGLLLAQPYRIAPAVEAQLVLPAERSAMLPASSAPIVAALRAARPLVGPAT